MRGSSAYGCFYSCNILSAELHYINFKIDSNFTLENKDY